MKFDIPVKVNEVRGRIMAKKASSKPKTKSKTRATKKSAARAIRPAGLAAAAEAAAPTSAIIDQITALAAASTIVQFRWNDRGRAPIGYIKGMAVAFARALCKFQAGDPAAAEMAKADTHNAHDDALTWYAPEFQALGLSNGSASADTLRHVFVLLMGLGMRESSGQHCEGRDRSASNTTAETAEAGLFQVSFNARSASSLLPALFQKYRDDPSGFVEIFHEGVNCSAASLQNFGSGDGAEFQRLTKECPAFAAEFAAVALRHIRRHWGPINTKKAQLVRDCDTMLRGVQDLVNASPGACQDLQ